MTGGGEGEECSVCVAVNIRPLIGQEIVEGCQECLNVTPGQPQVSCCAKSFMFDKVYGNCGAESPDNLFPDCVETLVDGLFKGYNATVLAYGQTGSGKTYTMGSAFTPGGNTRGVIPLVLDRIFEKVETTPDTEFAVQVSFVEIHKEEIRDLLCFENGSRPVISVREVPGGGVCLAGASEKAVRSKEETAELLEQGSLARATASTGMNAQSSRSHAIFTITVEQKKQMSMKQDEEKMQGSSDDEGQQNGEEERPEGAEADLEGDEEVVDDYLCAKMHLVDLAGSERAKRTKVTGARLQEGIDINRGLLALGKVISALVEGQKHVPYRDSKLTRLLQDSLGGNSRTTMIACVSPADINMEETLNTIRYANRARSIKNKPVVNRDPQAAQLAYLRQQLALARSELSRYKNAARSDMNGEGGGNPLIQEALEQAEKERKDLEAQTARLRVQLDGALADVEEAKRHQVEAQCMRDGLKMENQRIKGVLQELQNRGVDVPIAMGDSSSESSDLMQEYLDQIAALELENKRLRQLQEFSADYMQRQAAAGPANPQMGAFTPAFSHIPELEDVDAEMEQNARRVAEEEAYRLEQDRLAQELEDLERNLGKKEELASRLVQPSEDANRLRKQYEKQLKDLETDRSKLEKERTDLVVKLHNMKAATSEDKLKLEEKYRNQLKEKDDKLKELKKKEKYFQKVEKLKAKEEDINRKLKSDIERIKSQKVQLVKQIEFRAKEYNERLRRSEKEMLQLKKQGRVNAAKLQRIEALHNKQQAVLKRKTEEAEAARKRLKEMVSVAQRNQMEARRKTGNTVECQPNQGAPLLRDEKSRREWLERELDVCNQSWDLKRILDAEVEQRKHASKELREIEKRLEHLENPTLSPKGIRDESREKILTRKAELEQKCVVHSQEIAQLQPAWEKAKSEEDSKSGASADSKRWTGVKTVAEARTMLKSLFKCSSDLRGQVNELQGENVRMTEETGFMQTRMDELTQELQVVRMSTARAEAAAVTAAALTARKGSNTEEQAEEKSNKEVENFIQQLANATKGQDVEEGGAAQNASEAESSDSESEVDEDEVPPRADAVFPKSKRVVNAEMSPEEEELLEIVNERRKDRGDELAVRLTVRVLEIEVKRLKPGWTRGSKSKDAVITDFRQLLGEEESKEEVRIESTPRRTEKTLAYLKKREDMLSTIQRAVAGSGIKNSPSLRRNSFARPPANDNLQNRNGSGAARFGSGEDQSEIERFASLTGGANGSGGFSSRNSDNVNRPLDGVSTNGAPNVP
ncbi:hypothetical protein BSKO_12838 [Bryopsis sp. KO-2023]|nr:hypothetical protein BSKO_12838 [Bryopsis sp. KO-2023]